MEKVTTRQKLQKPIPSKTKQNVNNLPTDASRASNNQQETIPLDTAPLLFERLCKLPCEIVSYILCKTDLKTILAWRFTSKIFYNLASPIVETIYLYCPLVAKALISFKYAQINSEIAPEIRELYDFVIKYTGINISISFDDFIKEESNLAKKLNSLAKNDPSITLSIANSRELRELLLLVNNGLNENQKLIIKKTTILNLFPKNCDYSFNEYVYIDHTNIEKIELLLIMFAPELTKLKIGYLNCSFSLPQLPKLKVLEFGNIKDALELPILYQLTSLTFEHINSNVILKNLPNLRILRFRKINPRNAALTLQKEQLKCINKETLELHKVFHRKGDRVKIFGISKTNRLNSQMIVADGEVVVDL